MEAVITAAGLHKSYQSTRYPVRTLKEALIRLLPRHRSHDAVESIHALQGVSFEVPRGDSLAILGPNGAGKSTLMRLLSGTCLPDHGEITIRGRIAPLLQIGAGFNPDLTGKENIMMACSMYGWSKRRMQEKLPDIVAFAELEPFIDTPMKYYSSGMQARLGFATAIHLDADVLLVDEALAVGDQAFQAKCVQRIREIQSSGVSLVFVTHSHSMARAFCDHAIVLEGGRIVQSGTMAEVLPA